MKTHARSDETHQLELDGVGKEEVVFWQHLFNLSCGDGEHSWVYAGVETNMPEHHINVTLSKNFIGVGAGEVLCREITLSDMSLRAALPLDLCSFLAGSKRASY